MANMSYCRFRNTELDLNDCIGALEDLADDSEMDQPQNDEINAAERMRELCERYIESYDAWKSVDKEDEM